MRLFEAGHKVPRRSKKYKYETFRDIWTVFSIQLSILTRLLLNNSMGRRRPEKTLGSNKVHTFDMSFIIQNNTHIPI